MDNKIYQEYKYNDESIFTNEYISYKLYKLIEL